jgi:DNA polymerase-3 subunit beta
MKFSTNQNVILKALALISGGIGKSLEHSTVKVTADATSKNVTLEARNLDVRIKSFFQAQVEVSGNMNINFVKLNEIIKKLNQTSDVFFESKDSSLAIKNGKSKFSIQTADMTEEEVYNITVKSSFKIMSKKLLSIVNKTKFSIYPDETRFNLNGLLFQFKQTDGSSFINSVSTDGHRLSFAKLEAEMPNGASFSKIILPKKTTMELCKILEQAEDEELQVSLFEKRIDFSSKTFYLQSKLIDAEFPEYEKVIPQENTKIVTIPRKELMSLIERVSTIHAGSSESGIKLSFVENLLTISAKNKESEEALDEIITESAFSEQIEVSYNYAYLLEILSHTSSEKVVFALKDERTPALIKDEKLDSYFYILMPMRF